MVWVDIAPPTREEEIESAELLKAQLLAGAAEAISPLQDAVDLSMASEAETASLSAWKNTGYYLTVLIPLRRLILSGQRCRQCGVKHELRSAIPWPR